jgi:hypothetical protein
MNLDDDSGGSTRRRGQRPVYLNGEPGKGSSQECDDEAPTALFVVMMAAASLIREHAREVTRFIIEEMPTMMRGIRPTTPLNHCPVTLRRGRRNGRASG